MVSFIDQIPTVVSSPAIVGSTNMFSVGGTTVATQVGAVDTIEYFDGFTVANGVDRGDLTTKCSRCGCTYNKSSDISVNAGGFTEIAPPVFRDVVEQFDRTILVGNASARTTLSALTHEMSGSSGNQFSFFAGGFVAAVGHTDKIEALDTSILVGGVSDKGDLTAVTRFLNASSVGDNNTSAIMGGFTPPGNTALDKIDQFDNTSAAVSNASDDGDLALARGAVSSVESNGTAFALSGSDNSGNGIDIIETYAMGTTPPITTSDKGDLLFSQKSGVAEANSSFVNFFGGLITPADTTINNIQQVNATTTTENASDVADLTEAKHLLGGG